MKKAILGLGEEAKADDGVGKYVIDGLKKRKSRHLLLYSEVPENAFSKLRNKDIGELTIVDAADFSGKPGEIRVMSEFKEAVRLSTHSTSASNLVRYIKKSIGIKHVTLVLVQAKRLEFGKKMSPEVRQAGDMVVDLLST
jgi:hydrogenase maturation protease